MRLWIQWLKNLSKRSFIALLVSVFLGTLFFIGSNILVVMSVDRYVVSEIEENVLPADAVIVLWAKVYSDGRLSWAVQERADAAIALRTAGKARKILVSGDNRTRYYDEVTTIKKYLFAQNIPAEAIFLDFAWLDTYDSMYRAQYIFQIRSLLVPTQGFHVHRAVFLARSLWIEAYGLVPDRYALTPLRRLYVREFFARGKALLDLLMNTWPRHLGDTIPITGMSNSM
jgi:SanA protein